MSNIYMQKQIYTFSIDIEVKAKDTVGLNREAEYTYKELHKAINDACDYLIANVTVHRLEPIDDESTLES